MDLSRSPNTPGSPNAHFPRGVWVPLVTPFAGGEVDHPGLARLVKSFAGSGIAGFVVCGSTGEAATLTQAEHRAVLATVMESAPGVPVVMGVSGIGTGELQEKLLRWAEQPLAGFLISAPSYVKPSQAGIAAHFAALADVSPLPILLYDIPARTGVRIETATMLGLAAHPRIVGVKDCSGDLDHLQALLSDGRLAVLCGDDHRILQSLCLGAAGMVAASAHLHPERFVELQALVDHGCLPQARALWKKLWPLTLALFTEPSPGPLKSALARRLGLAEDLRPPMTRASSQAAQQVEQALSAL